MVCEKPLFVFDRGIDDVAGIDPFRAVGCLGRYARGVEQILDVIIKPLGLLAQAMRQRC